MVIDFHTHIFPDKIAAGAVSALAHASGSTPHTNGTQGGLLSAIRKAGVDIAVNLPVLTSPAQFEGVLRFAAGLNEAFSRTGRGILSFAGAHPGMPDVAGRMRAIRDAGFRGIKIHPEYQDTFIDDEASYRLLAAAKENGLITVTHAGVDAAYRNRPARCTPARIARVLDRLGGYPQLVLAHLGGNELLGEVEAHLLGREVYLDTAYVMPYIKREALLSVIEGHGKERILFATDSPWQAVDREVGRLRGLRLPDDALECILYKNAKELLHI